MKFIKLAQKCSSESNYPSKLGAVLVRGGCVISRGHNRVDRLLNGTAIRSVHAEEDAIRKANGRAKGCALIVVRVLKNKNMSMSFPCKRCLPQIIAAGIKTVIYTDWSGSLQVQRL